MKSTVEEKKSTTDTVFKVKDLFIHINDTLVKNRLASFVVNGVSAFIETKATFLKCIGRLNKFSILDDFFAPKVNGNENIFVEKLIAHGKKPIEFEFFKNIGHPEFLKTKMFESYLKLKLDSAKYIHVQSFLINLVNYFQQLLNNMDALGRMRALASGQKGISFNYQRGSRVQLDIDIQDPTLILPLNSKSKNALVLKFDSIKVDNKFILSNQSDILSMNSSNQDYVKETLNENQNEERDCLLDCMEIKCANMFAYSAKHIEKSTDEKQNEFQVRFDSFLFKKFAENISLQKYSFNLQIERNLENELSHKSPDWNIYTKFTSTMFKLNFEQYKIIRGFLDQNLGEQIKPNVSQLNFLIPNTKLETVLTGNVWKAMRIHLDMSTLVDSLANRN